MSISMSNILLNLCQFKGLCYSVSLLFAVLCWNVSLIYNMSSSAVYILDVKGKVGICFLIYVRLK